MVEFLGLIARLAGHIHAQLTEHIGVHLGEDHSGMGITAREFCQMFHRPFRIGIGHGADGQGNEGLIGMEPGIVVAQMRYLEVLDGFDDLRRNEMPGCRPGQPVP